MLASSGQCVGCGLFSLLISTVRAQVDLDMLNVALGRGTLELRSALLNTDYLNSQLVRAPRASARFSPLSFYSSDSRLRLPWESRASRL